MTSVRAGNVDETAASAVAAAGEGGLAAPGLWSLEDALETMLRAVTPRPPEPVRLEDALGRFLAEPLVAAVAVPPFDNSAMDGFAVIAEDVVEASESAPVRLRVVGEAAAGHAPAAALLPGTAVRVLTGGMLPGGADAVVPVEETDAAAGVAALPETVLVRHAAGVGAHIRRAGSDQQPGQRLLPAGVRIGPGTIGVAASAGAGTLSAFPRPRVAVLSTGDELVPAGVPLRPGTIHDANGPMLRALAATAGARVVTLEPAPDDLDAIEDRLREAISDADVVIASGGVSVGAHDLVRLAFERLGRVDLWRVAVQPGKPVAFGRAGSALLFGLPGNPVSSFVTFEIFVRPVLRRLAGDPEPTRRRLLRAVAGERLAGDRDRRAFLRVRLETGDDGSTRAVLAGAQGSHVLSALALADGLAVKPEGLLAIEPGEHVDVWELDR